MSFLNGAGKTECPHAKQYHQEIERHPPNWIKNVQIIPDQGLKSRIYSNLGSQTSQFRNDSIFNQVLMEKMSWLSNKTSVFDSPPNAPFMLKLV